MRPDKKKKPYKGKSGNAASAKSVPVGVTESSPAAPPQPKPIGDGKTEKPVVPDPSGCKAVDVTQLVAKQKDSDTINNENESTETTTKTFAKRKVFSNWERYVEPEHVCEVELEERQALDFESLLKAPVSADGHFFFKSEKLEAPPTSNLFTLDLQSLSDGLKSIPFYRQLDLPTSYFSASEIEKMDKEAANVLHELSDTHVNKMIQLLTTNTTDEFTLAAETETQIDDSNSQVNVEMQQTLLADSPETLTEKSLSQFISKPQRLTSFEGPKSQREKYIPPKSSSTPVTLKVESLSTSLTSSIKEPVSLAQDSPLEAVVQAVPSMAETTTSLQDATTSSPEAVVQAVITEPPKGQRERKPRKLNPVSPPSQQVRIETNKLFDLSPAPAIDIDFDKLLADDNQVDSLLNKVGIRNPESIPTYVPVIDNIVDKLLSKDNLTNNLRDTQASAPESTSTNVANAKSNDDLEAWLDSVLDD